MSSVKWSVVTRSILDHEIGMDRSYPSLTSQLGDFRELGDHRRAVQIDGIECDHPVAGQGPAQFLHEEPSSLQVKVRVQVPFQVQGRAGQDRDRVAEHAHAVVENDVVGAEPPFEAGTVGRAVQLPDEVERARR